jgi:hypothetical protein
MLAAGVIVVIAVVLVIALGGSTSHPTAPPVAGPVSASQTSTSTSETSTSTTQTSTSTTNAAGTASVGQGAGSGGLAPASRLTTQNTTSAISLGQTATFALTNKGAQGPLVSVRAVSMNNHPIDQDDFLQGEPAGSKLAAILFEVQSAVGADDVTDFIGFGGSDSSVGNDNPDTVVAGPDCVFHNQTAGGPPLTARRMLTFCLLYTVSPKGHLATVTASPIATPQDLGIATATWNLP